MKVLIVGGVAGGASAAARLRRLSEDIEIIIFERGKYISYANCGLPYYIGGVISDRERLFVQTPEGMRDRYNIDVRVENEVLSIDKEKKEVLVKELKTGRTYKESYDKLILSPGAEPLKPNIPGIEHSKIYVLRTVPDTDRLKKIVDSSPRGNAVVVGGGFIGVETAENLKHQGLEVSLVEAMPHILGNLDYEMAAYVEEHFRLKGVNLYLSNRVVEFLNEEERLKVVLQDGTVLETDFVVLAIGVRPDSKLAVEAGLTVNEGKAIVVDEFLRTSDLDIYAVGDAVEITRKVDQKRACIPLAGPANRQGRIVADNILGAEIKYRGALGTSIAKVFDMSAGSTGLSERQVKSLGMPYRVSVTHSASHAAYYPNAYPLVIKLVYTPEGKILGAQVVGFDGVDKRLDVIATTLSFGGSVMDLTELELAYAPPFGSAKDPVNIAGYVASNVVNSDSLVVTAEEIDLYQEKDTIILDVREPIEFMLGNIQGSINIPLDSLRNRINELPKDKEIIIYCRVGLRGYLAERILRLNGFTKIKNLTGGYTTYEILKSESDQTSSIQLDKPMEVTSESEAIHTQKETGNVQNKVESFTASNTSAKEVKLDACSLQCPGPIMQTFKTMENLNEGDILEVTATDPGFYSDISAWARQTGNELLERTQNNGFIIARIKKGKKDFSINDQATSGNDKTLVVFSADLDKAIASMIIANGAASMGRKVTVFYTFWGLNILRRSERVPVKKGLLERMFGIMMPKGTKQLGLSRMNFLGIGPKLIRKVMHQKNIDSLEALLTQAKLNGVRLVACQMSMDVMGIKKEELIEGIEIGGVATYLDAAETANVNLFI